ncbi:xanthine dehydrogenase small subunit [Sphingomonas sp.]|uniref:xanthine dehydrogenase small subunit n=1 Tax=Sphingomonas sp. TaxID=28214 RepID=UPI000DB55AEB|nr:xanthine dehydrogenase small subunit [Sphingomonas sp.]PZU11687.1 MAG: xanthine dehydrogenase small subunit [Sphingomonas sp.]
MSVRFLLDGEVIETGPIDPTLTLLDFLRYRLCRTGTKEGCAEGDCGACTVLVGTLAEGRNAIGWRAVNACILFMGMIDGRALMTVESLSGRAPIQREMIARHGSQCGFCTPGFVMSLHGRSIGASGCELPVADVIAGNLCRCTGYGPILASGEAVPPQGWHDHAMVEALAAIQREEPLAFTFSDPLAGRTRSWFAPRTIDQLADHLLDHPDARIVAGATDVGLWVTKQHRILDEVVWVGDVRDFNLSTPHDDGSWTFAAGVTYASAHPLLAEIHPDLGELVRRIGGLQVRNSGTIGGNIANGSPIGDGPPALIALGATLVLRRGSETRELPLEDYFLAYGRQDRRPGEFVLAVRVPPAPSFYRVVKLSKRFDSDISAVCGAFGLEIEEGIVRSARIAFGGMAATPRRASACEAALVGKAWSEAAAEAAALALAEDYAPLSDMRGSSEYRLLVAQNLVRRLWAESAGDEPVSVLALADG